MTIPISVDAENLRCDVCISVPEDTEVTDPIKRQTIPAGDYVVAVRTVAALIGSRSNRRKLD